MVTIRRALPADQARWTELFRAYCRFYGWEAGDRLCAYTWQRIGDPACPVHAIVATDEAGRIVGFANYLTHENTTAMSQVCYLQDLFVDPDARAAGVGRALIDALVAETHAQGWARLYWQTRENNYRARGLYDQYTPHSGFVRYVLQNPAQDQRRFED
jgi:GNAT superfamily N-acetyltransferase